MWISLEPILNGFRTSLGLDVIRRGEAGARLLINNEVPFVKVSAFGCWHEGVTPT
jgi:hypothetical protein